MIHSLLVKIRKCPRVKKIYTIKSTLRNKTNTKRTMLNIKFKPKYTTKIKAVIFCLLKIYIFVVNFFLFKNSCVKTQSTMFLTEKVVTISCYNYKLTLI